MKDRIINSLLEFSCWEQGKPKSPMFNAICEELPIQPDQLKVRAREMLQSIVHNYAFFKVSTIDKFNQNLIRSCAFDLKIPVNFEVDLDSDTLIAKACDALIARAGSDDELTELLIDFALEKTNTDKSFNIEYDLKEIGKLLTNENHHRFAFTLKERSSTDFQNLSTSLNLKIRNVDEHLNNEASTILTMIEADQIEHNDFKGRAGLVPSFFKKIAKGERSMPLDRQWMEQIESEPLYPKSTDPEKAAKIDSLQPQIAMAFYRCRSLLQELKFLSNFKANLAPLSLLGRIDEEIQLIKEEDGILPISEFNTLISSHLRNQPAPYIYERIGERFKHFYIDEFQDTSVMQWENLKPLIGNALSGENASITIVGDAKQAIYRWRGGRVEQFIQLNEPDATPFYFNPIKHDLAVNYRSFQEIVDFNNSFFSWLSAKLFERGPYKTLYENAKQLKQFKQQGFVSINFLQPESGSEMETAYAQAVLDTVESCVEQGFDPMDICIMTRRIKEGKAIAEFLLTNSSLKVLSSETMRLDSSDAVNFILDLMWLISDPGDLNVKFEVLSFLAKPLDPKERHLFFMDRIALNLSDLFLSFKTLGFNLNLEEISKGSIYEIIETIMDRFKLVESGNGYLQFLLDVVHDFEMKRGRSITEFLDYFEENRERLTISSSITKEAVNIMTIHKTKGLEFPVVIFPFADVNIYGENRAKIWFPINEEEFSGFDHALINFNRDLEGFGDTGKDLYAQHISELELDNTNLLYVALTRAIEQLHIICKHNPPKSGQSPKRYNQLFSQYLMDNGQWQEDRSQYVFGDPTKMSSPSVMPSSIEPLSFHVNSRAKLDIAIASQADLLWDKQTIESVEKGNLLHLTMSKIRTRLDIEPAFFQLIESGIVSTESAGELKQNVFQIVEHPELKPYFSSEKSILIERDILSTDGKQLRPDRLVINSNNEVVILDYKSGKPRDKDKQQILEYEKAISEMGYTIKKKILIYLQDKIKLVEI